jgi:hypothetical protein
MQNARKLVPTTHPVRRFTAIQEIAFWVVVIGAGVGLYLLMASI